MRAWKVWRFALAVVSLSAISSSAVYAAELDLRVKNEKHQLIWCRVEVRGSDGKMYQGKGTLGSGERNPRGRLPWYLGSFLMNGTSTVELPAGTYTVVVEHGLEYNHFERQISVSDAVPIHMNVELRPWIRMEKKGWWSADMHVHRSPQEAPAVVQAEGLNLLCLTNRNKRQLFGEQWPEMKLTQVAPDRWISEKNVEDERGGGAWILHGLNDPLKLGRETGFYPPGLDYVRAALSQRQPGDRLPWFDIDMPIWWETPVMVALQTPDSIDIVNNQFMQYGIDTGAYWGKPIDRVTYPGEMGFVNYTLDLYYRYLNLGFKIAPSAGTGTGVMPSPAGYDRIYAHIDGPFSLEKWYAAVKHGDSFVTNGPILFFHTRRNGRFLIADLKAYAREPIARVELVANGKVIQSWSADSKLRFHASKRLEVGHYSWIAARCFLATPYTIRLAHSSPVYLDNHWDASEDARYFVNWIDALISHVQSEEARGKITPSQTQALISLYSRAREKYAQWQ